MEPLTLSDSITKSDVEELAMQAVKAMPCDQLDPIAEEIDNVKNNNDSDTNDYDSSCAENERVYASQQAKTIYSTNHPDKEIVGSECNTAALEKVNENSVRDTTEIANQSTRIEKTSSKQITSHPTKDYLNENFTKTDLQKYGREIGVRNVWVNKENLIQQILDRISDNENENSDIRSSKPKMSDNPGSESQIECKKKTNNVESRKKIGENGACDLPTYNDEVNELMINDHNHRLATLAEQLKELQSVIDKLNTEVAELKKKQ